MQEFLFLNLLWAYLLLCPCLCQFTVCLILMPWKYVCSMYFIYIMYSERAKSKIVCEETIPFWELECGKYLSYLFHSNNYYKICVLCRISWLPTHKIMAFFDISTLHKFSKFFNFLSACFQIARCFRGVP